MKATDPPVDAVPVTTRIALSLWVVSLVHPVGAADCWNSILVPEAATSIPSRAVTRPSIPLRIVWVAVMAPVMFGKVALMVDLMRRRWSSACASPSVATGLAAFKLSIRFLIREPLVFLSDYDAVSSSVSGPGQGQWA